MKADITPYRAAIGVAALIALALLLAIQAA
jgi:hypothetical protein